jgi:hypothetical protein
LTTNNFKEHTKKVLEKYIKETEEAIARCLLKNEPSAIIALRINKLLLITIKDIREKILLEEE